MYVPAVVKVTVVFLAALVPLTEKVTDAAPDVEVGRHSFYFVLESGKIDYVPYDQPLHIVLSDSEHQELLQAITGKIDTTNADAITVCIP